MAAENGSRYRAAENGESDVRMSVRPVCCFEVYHVWRNFWQKCVKIIQIWAKMRDLG